MAYERLRCNLDLMIVPVPPTKPTLLGTNQVSSTFWLCACTVVWPLSEFRPNLCLPTPLRVCTHTHTVPPWCLRRRVPEWLLLSHLRQSHEFCAHRVDSGLASYRIPATYSAESPFVRSMQKCVLALPPRHVCHFGNMIPPSINLFLLLVSFYIYTHLVE